MSQQCTVTEKVKNILHCTNISTPRRQKEEIIPLYSTLTGLKYCIQFLMSPNTGKTLINWTEFSEGPLRSLGDWSVWKFTRPDGIKSWITWSDLTADCSEQESGLVFLKTAPSYDPKWQNKKLNTLTFFQFHRKRSVCINMHTSSKQGCNRTKH